MNTLKKLLQHKIAILYVLFLLALVTAVAASCSPTSPTAAPENFVIASLHAADPATAQWDCFPDPADQHVARCKVPNVASVLLCYVSVPTGLDCGPLVHAKPPTPPSPTSGSGSGSAR